MVRRGVQSGPKSRLARTGGLGKTFRAWLVIDADKHSRGAGIMPEGHLLNAATIRSSATTTMIQNQALPK